MYTFRSVIYKYDLWLVSLIVYYMSWYWDPDWPPLTCDWSVLQCYFFPKYMKLSVQKVTCVPTYNYNLCVPTLHCNLSLISLGKNLKPWPQREPSLNLNIVSINTIRYKQTYLNEILPTKSLFYGANQSWPRHAWLTEMN